MLNGDPHRRRAARNTTPSLPAAICVAPSPIGRVDCARRRLHLRPPRTQSLFAALAESIVYQQLSGKAAATILGPGGRAYHPKDFPADRVISWTRRLERLRAAGLSRRQDRGAPRSRGADHRRDSAVDRRSPGGWMTRHCRAAHHGARRRDDGRWRCCSSSGSAAPTSCPLGDLGVRKGYARTFRTRALPSPEAMRRRAERWRPYRSVASWYLWRAMEL